MAATEPEFPADVSPWEADVVRYLAGHLDAETEFVEAYRGLADAPDTDPAVRYLINLVVEDEERHHRVLRELVDSIDRRGRELGHPYVSPVPTLPSQPGGDEKLAELTKRFLAAERADRRELRQLQRRLRPARGSTLWPLLVDLMERDTAKHIAVLTFIKERIAPYRRMSRPNRPPAD